MASFCVHVDIKRAYIENTIHPKSNLKSKQLQPFLAEKNK